MSRGDKVWLFEESCVGVILSYGTFFSLVEWAKDGVTYQEYLEHTEYSEYERVEDEEN